MSNIVRVAESTPYNSSQLGSMGRASMMLIAQHAFPAKYDQDTDVMIVADHDRCLGWNYAHASRVIREHTGSGDMGIGDWARRASKESLIAFAKDILKAGESNPGVKWTGCRILGTVNRSNGYTVWSIYLFAKGKGSRTKTSDGACESFYKTRGLAHQYDEANDGLSHWDFHK